MLPVLLAACDGGGSGAGTLPPPGECQAVLSPASAVPGTSVVVSGLPPALVQPQGTLSAGGQALPAALVRDSAGGLTMIVPVHPAGAPGGAATVQITGNGISCRPASLTIAPLPAAPGAVQATIDSAVAALGRIAAGAGLDAEALRGDTTQVPAELRPLQMALRVLDHGQNPNSVRAMLAGGAPILAGEAVDVALLESVLVSSGARAAAVALLNALARDLPEPSALTERWNGFGWVQGGSPARYVPGGGPAPSAGSQPVIRNAAMLSLWMRRQRNAEVGTLAEAQRFNRTIRVAAAAIGLHRAAKPATILVSTLATGLNLTVTAHAGMLPSELSEMQLEAFPTQFPEDWEVVGQWTARVTARSRGLRFPLPSTTAQAVSSTPWLGDEISGNPQAAALFDEVFRAVATSLSGSLGQTVSVEDGYLVAAQRSWPGIDISDARYSLRTLSAPGVIELVPEFHRDYRPVAPGQANLIVTSNPATFSGQAIRREQTITVQRIEIQVQAERSPMRPGTDQQLSYTISGALDPSVRWSSTCGTVTADGGGFAVFRAPSQVGRCTVTARHASRAERTGSIDIEVADVVTVAVRPASGTLLRGQQQTLTATVEGTPDTRVTWNASRGSITQTGVYTAPQDTGAVTITATSVADPTRVGTARLRVVNRLVAYEVVELGLMETRAVAINNLGQIIAGRYLWQNGEKVDLLPALERAWGRGTMENVVTRDLNDRGQIVGAVESYYDLTCSFIRYAFVWQAGSARLLAGESHQQGTTTCTDAEASSINRNGLILGRERDRTGWRADLDRLFTVSETLPLARASCGYAPFPGDYTGLLGINDAGHYGTTYSSRLAGGDFQHYCTDPRGDRMYADEHAGGRMPAEFHAQSVEDDGAVLGYVVANNEFRGAIWRLSGGLTLLPFTASEFVLMGGRNEGGDIVGHAGTADGGFPFLVRGQAVYNLNLLIPEEWEIGSPSGINRHGWIIATGARGGIGRGNVLLRPVAPLPSPAPRLVPQR